MTKKMLITLMAVAIATTAFAQAPDTLWTQTYDGDNVCYSVQQTFDGGYILGGTTLVKVDALGMIEWEQALSCNSVKQTTDGGYILGGTSSMDMHLVKTDASGNVVWERTYGGTEDEEGNSVLQTTDGGYILGGYTESFGVGFDDMYLVKTDANGDTLWTKTYGGTGDDRCNSVQQTVDEGFILGGCFDFYAYPDPSYMYLVKTDYLGNQEWETTFFYFEYNLCNSVQQVSDDGFIMGGSTGGPRSSLMYLVKTNSMGNFEWEYVYSGSPPNTCMSVQETTDGGYIVGGHRSGLMIIPSLIGLKMDSLGNIIWEAFPSTTYGTCNSVKQTSDGGFIFAGETNYPHIQLHRFASEEPLQVEVSLTPENPPITIPATGGPFDFNVLIINDADYMAGCHAWIDVTLPNGTVYGPLLGPINLALPGGAFLERDRTQDVPANAPSGIYTYNAYLGTFPSNVVWDDNSFTFEKLETGDGVPVNNWSNGGEGFEAWVTTTEVDVPNNISLLGNYPNPFNPATTISFALPEASHVTLTVFDLHGRVVSELVNGLREVGVHEITFDASQLASGLYFYRIEAGDFSAVEKMILMK